MQYRVVDVFAERPLEGNPLTVVIDAEGLDDAQMQAIARETNHSETTFATGRAPDGTPRVRIFTPAAELPFAGHPTLGTAHVLGAWALDLNIGRIHIDREGDLLWMTQKPATFGPPLNPAMLSTCLGVEALGGEVVSTGTPVAIVPVADIPTLRAAELDARRYVGPDIAGIYVFAPRPDGTVQARFFADFVGIHEDPATGGAAGPLAAWLHRAGRLEGTQRIHQGIEMGRPSILHIRHGETPEVGGKVQDVARGTFVF